MSIAILFGFLLDGLLDDRQVELCPYLKAEFSIQGDGWVIGFDVEKWGFAAVQDSGNYFGHEGVSVASATVGGMSADGADFGEAGEVETLPCQRYE